MEEQAKSTELRALEKAVQELIRIDPQDVLEGLSCENPVHRAQSWALVALAGWDASDVFLAAMDQAARGE